MLRLLWIGLIALSCALLVSGCGNNSPRVPAPGSGTLPTPSQPPATGSSLEGSWKSACVVDSYWAQQLTLTFRSGTLSYSMAYYHDELCTESWGEPDSGGGAYTESGNVVTFQGSRFPYRIEGNKLHFGEPAVTYTKSM